MSSIVDVFLRYGVPYQRTEARGGWVSTFCPFCTGSEENYLGFSLERSYFRCWSCGFHAAVPTLEKLCHVDRATASGLYQSIRDGSSRGIRHAAADREVQAKVNFTPYRRPSDIKSIFDRNSLSHLLYLNGRGFDPERIAREWGVMATGPTSELDVIDYRFRLLIPIIWDCAEVSFTTRDVTGKSDLRYVSCPSEREKVPHKHILYGRQECWGDVGIVVEGVTDVWKLGTRACAVFGIQYRPEQVREIARRFKRVAIVFDAETAAQNRARKLAAYLNLLLEDPPIVVDLGKGVDPGSMAQDDAAHLVKELTK